MESIRPGVQARTRQTVTNENAISFLGRDDARVLGTPWMIAYLEMTARNAVRPLLADNEDTVGTEVHVRHLAAAPMGVEVEFEAEVTAVEGRRIRFRVAARDGRDLICDGVHERAVIDVGRFAARVQAKKAELEIAGAPD